MSNTETKMHESELLDKLICDYGPTKYLDIVWAMEWARCLRGREEYRHLPMAEMIEKAMLEVTSGQVTSEQILATIYGSAGPAKPEPAADAKADGKKASKSADDTEKPAKKAEKKAEKAAEAEEEPKKAKKEKAKKD